MSLKSSRKAGFIDSAVLVRIIIVAIALPILSYVWGHHHSSKLSSAAVANQAKSVASYEDCKAALGSSVQQGYPTVCTTAAGAKFLGPTSSSTGTVTTASSSQGASTYLAIKEWGVKLSVPTSATDLNYFFYQDNPDYVFLSLKSVTDLEPNCAADKSAVAVISRLSPSENSSAKSDTRQPKEPVVISNNTGGYYYWYTYKGCTASNPANQAAIDKILSDANLNGDFKTLQVGQ